MGRKKKELKISIINIDTNQPEEVNASLFYKITCQKDVSKHYYAYKKCLTAYGIELEDLKQEILLMIWQILVNNSKTKKISPTDLGGYLFNATRWKLNSILSKAMTAYKHTISDSTYHIETIAEPTTQEKLTDSEKILILFCDQHGAKLPDILNKICTEKEALATKEYYFNKLNTTEISLKMKLSSQRVSALINSALLKLNFYFTQFITSRSDDE